jgi:DNA-binding transcriptional regulator LsrR (DeoR family)
MNDVGHLLANADSHRADLDQDRLLVKVARLYYESDLTQARIAQRMRLSRQKVQRLLDSAKEKGVVRIVVEPLQGVHAEKEKGLEERYGLAEAVVVETSSYNDQSVVARETGVGAADYLLRVVRPKDRVVLSWGGTLLGMVNGVRRHPHRDLHGVLVIQGLGGVADPGRDTHSSELARRLAQFLGGRAMPLPAPGVAGNRAARNAFLRDAHVAKVLDAARAADVAFVGIGAPRQDSILVREGSIVKWEELEALKARGAVGDINLRYFDRHGSAITSDLDDRVVGIALEDFRRIPHVVGVAGGAAKLEAIRGALQGKLVDVLITDHITAQRLLEGDIKPTEPRAGKVRGRKQGGNR